MMAVVGSCFPGPHCAPLDPRAWNHTRDSQAHKLHPSGSHAGVRKPVAMGQVVEIRRTCTSRGGCQCAVLTLMGSVHGLRKVCRRLPPAPLHMNARASLPLTITGVSDREKVL
jgi:hypothetical protein